MARAVAALLHRFVRPGSIRFTIGIDDVSDRLNDVTKGHVVQNSNGTARQAELRLVNGEYVLALGNAVGREAEVTCPKRNAIRQFVTYGKSRRRADYHQGVASPIEFLARDDNHRVRAGLIEIGHVALAGPDHGASSIRPTALGRPSA